MLPCAVAGCQLLFPVWLLSQAEVWHTTAWRRGRGRVSNLSQRGSWGCTVDSGSDARWVCFTVTCQKHRTDLFTSKQMHTCLVSGCDRLDTRRNCGRRILPDESAWGRLSSVTKHRANFWIKWQLHFGGGGTGISMIHTWSTMIGPTSKCNWLIHVVMFALFNVMYIIIYIIKSHAKCFFLSWCNKKKQLLKFDLIFNDCKSI